MKKVKMNKIEKMLKDGKVECVTDLKVGYVELLFFKSGKREMVQVIF